MSAPARAGAEARGGGPGRVAATGLMWLVRRSWPISSHRSVPGP